MPQPTLGPEGVVGILVPWGNTTAQLEVEPLTPPGVINAVARFDFGPGIDVDAELSAVAAKLTYTEPAAVLLSLSPEMFEGGLERAAAYQALIAEASGVPAFTTTGGIFHELRRLDVSSIGLIAPAPQEQMESASANFASEGITVVRAVGMNCGIENIKATPLDDIASAFRAVDDPTIEAFVQTGTGLPAFATAQQVEAELGRPVITANAAGYRQTLHTLGIDAPA